MDDVEKYQFSAIKAALDDIQKVQKDVHDRVIRIEAVGTPQKLDALESKHIDLDKRVVGIETKNRIESGGISALTSGVVAWLVHMATNGGGKT